MIFLKIVHESSIQVIVKCDRVTHPVHFFIEVGWSVNMDYLW